MSDRLPMSLFAILAIYLVLLAGGGHATHVARAGLRAEAAGAAVVVRPGDERSVSPPVARAPVEVGTGGAQGG